MSFAPNLFLKKKNCFHPVKRVLVATTKMKYKFCFLFVNILLSCFCDRRLQHFQLKRRATVVLT